MVNRVGVSAAEKYAELKARDEARPKCECHGVEKAWAMDNRRPMGGGWRCAEKSKECRRTPEYRERRNTHDRERHVNDAKYRARNRERNREYMRRRYGWYEPGGMATQEEMERFSTWKIY